MDSRIILSKADFSANNIGRYVELSNLTKKVLAKQTQYEEGSAESLALNDFLSNLTLGGFIGGTNPLLTYLAIPALASEHSELLYNIAQLDAEGYPVNSMNETEASAEASSRVFGLVSESSHVLGLYRTDVNASAQGRVNSRLFGTIGIEYPSFSMIAYGIGGLDANNDNRILNNEAVNYIVGLDTSEARLSYETNAYVKTHFTDANVGKGFYGVCYKPGVEFIGFAGADGHIGTTEVVGTPSVMKTQNDSNMFNIGRFVYDNDKKFKFSAIAFGNGMTIEQLTALKSYFDTLMTALHVNEN